LPEPVLKKAAAPEMLDCNGSGMFGDEMSHRSKIRSHHRWRRGAFAASSWMFRQNYKILFLQGGASTSFAWFRLI